MPKFDRALDQTSIVSMKPWFPVERRRRRKVFAVDGGMTNANSRARNVKVHLTEEIREKFHFMIFSDMQYDVLLGLPF
jgi:hypothetical protein